MLDPGQIGDIERRMKEEHKRDLEALQRLLKYLPDSGNTQPVAVTPDTRTAKKAYVPVSRTSGRGRKSGLKQAVRDIILGGPLDRTWTRREVKEVLDHDRFEIRAKDGVAALNQTLRSLVDDGAVQVVVQGSGSQMSEYRVAPDLDPGAGLKS